MKNYFKFYLNLLIYSFFVTVIISTVSIAIAAFFPNEKTAKVSRTDNLFVFIKCEPTDE